MLPLTFQNVGEITLELLFLFWDKIPCQKRLVGGKGYSGSQPKGTGRQAGAVAEAGTRGSCPLAFAVRKPGAKNLGKQLSLFSHPSRSQAWVGNGASHAFIAPPISQHDQDGLLQVSYFSIAAIEHHVQGSLLKCLIWLPVSEGFRAESSHLTPQPQGAEGEKNPTSLLKPQSLLPVTHSLQLDHTS